ncbi:MAG: hypothetical protein M3Y57_19145 [Acidobacteriota bacterium]|jgi:hypothetical protein|nr:hypothetical protein [Acidobacteriota bacterium]
MASRGRQTFNKRQKEQQRKEKQQEKFARRLERKTNPDGSEIIDDVEPLDELDQAATDEILASLVPGLNPTEPSNH